jgi:hypothetical protein
VLIGEGLAIQTGWGENPAGGARKRWRESENLVSCSFADGSLFPSVCKA